MHEVILSLLVGFSAGVIETVCLLKLRVAETLADAAPWGQLAGRSRRRSRSRSSVSMPRART